MRLSLKAGSLLDSPCSLPDNKLESGEEKIYALYWLSIEIIFLSRELSV
jgi:hypothetical protein